MNNNNPLVSIIIPNWNGIEHLPVCLDSLARQTYQPVDVIVVDNASTDGSLDLLRGSYPWVKTEALAENRGFTGACNAGMRVAQGAIVILLNNDTEVESDWAEQVVGAFGRHPEAGMVASKMLLFDDRDKLHTAGDFVRVDGIPGNRGVWQADGPEYHQERMVFSACGGSAAYRRTMLDKIGLLDDSYFFSLEDVDMGWRAQLSGWQCVYAPDAVVYHKLKATGGGVTASYYDGRNLIWLIAKNYPGDLLRRHWRAVIGGQVRLALDALRAWRGKEARARLRGMLVGLLKLPKWLGKRQQVQAQRTVDATYIESMLSPVED